MFNIQPNTLYSVSLIYFLGAATAFDMFGTDNAEELLTCGFQYPSLPISILHFVARIFARGFLKARRSWEPGSQNSNIRVRT